MGISKPEVGTIVITVTRVSMEEKTSGDIEKNAEEREGLIGYRDFLKIFMHFGRVVFILRVKFFNFFCECKSNLFISREYRPVA